MDYFSISPINPAFSIAEIVWILNGKNESGFLNFWNSQLPKYAGNVSKYYGAYGERLQYNFGINQLELAFKTLRSNPNSRQVVLQIWDATKDLPINKGIPRSEDIPCNIASLLKVRNHKLEWTQILRSNDLFLGLPYNILQFTTLQEIIAGWLNIDVGSYNHLSDSLHIYVRDEQSLINIKQSKIKQNTDSLAIDRKLSKKVFQELAQKIELLIRPGCNTNDTIKIIKWNGPQAYKNLLFILVAESLRKKKNIKLAKEICNLCSNPVLVQVWKNWCGRNKNFINRVYNC